MIARDAHPAPSIGLVALVALAVLTSSCGGAIGFFDLLSRTPRASRELRVNGARLSMEVSLRAEPVSLDAFEAWTRRAAAMIVEYFGRFPVPRLHVRVVTGTFGAISVGFFRPGPVITVVAGQDTRAAALEHDTVLVHEMAHVSFVNLDRRHRWMREGLSTYLETVLRARAGIVTEKQVWERWVRSMPLGLARPGERGLNHTSTWASTYWGGALFWLLIDVEVRERTNGRRSLQNILRAVLEQGGDARVRWSIERVIRVADEATETSVFSDRYEAMARRRASTDLDALFRRLGVIEGRDGSVRFDDEAPLAALRRSMNAPIGTRLMRVPP